MKLSVQAPARLVCPLRLARAQQHELLDGKHSSRPMGVAVADDPECFLVACLSCGSDGR